jgi:hypothetical protein
LEHAFILNSNKYDLLEDKREETRNLKKIYTNIYIHIYPFICIHLFEIIVNYLFIFVNLKNIYIQCSIDIYLAINM